LTAMGSGGIGLFGVDSTDELVKLLGYFDFDEVRKGKTSGSRVRFMNQKGVPIMLHKPHPTGIMKHYQLKQIKDILGL
jgi:hypothetical protein